MRLTKHQGWGNDFLIWLEKGRAVPIEAENIQRLCDRHTGVGADGLVRATPTDDASVDAAMDLYNADGTRAEMSGNGVRCLVQALLLEGWAAPPEAVVATDAGVRKVYVLDEPLRSPEGMMTHALAVDMGEVLVGPDALDWALAPSGRAVWVDTGNPHVVIEATGLLELETIDLAELGRKLDAAIPEGANVHVMAPGPEPGGVTLRSYERGVGLTKACGTGACAAAAVARRWGWFEGEASDGVADDADRTVAVQMEGGRAEVTLGETVRLTGPATAVAAIDYPWP
jgi:diaminopimelate epimerase